jgi:hypothetical protein
MGMSLAEAMENAARGESFGHLGYAHGFEYFMFNGEVYRAPYENPMGTTGYRQGARWEARALTGRIVDSLSDGAGNPVAQPEGRYQIRRSVGLGHWYVSDTLGSGPVDRLERVRREVTPYFKTENAARRFRDSLQSGRIKAVPNRGF